MLQLAARSEKLLRRPDGALLARPLLVGHVRRRDGHEARFRTVRSDIPRTRGGQGHPSLLPDSLTVGAGSKIGPEAHKVRVYWLAANGRFPRAP